MVGRDGHQIVALPHDRVREPYASTIGRKITRKYSFLVSKTIYSYKEIGHEKSSSGIYDKFIHYYLYYLG